MKLRNKNTGDEVKVVSIKPLYKNKLKLTYVLSSGIVNERYYNSIEKFNDDWEDYKPSEPLIKDEKIRKAVRAWWEAVPDAITDKRVFYKNNQDLAIGVYTIYCGAIYPETLEVGKMYTIEELCGEEE